MDRIQASTVSVFTSRKTQLATKITKPSFFPTVIQSQQKVSVSQEKRKNSARVQLTAKSFQKSQRQRTVLRSIADERIQTQAATVFSSFRATRWSHEKST